MEIDSLIIKKTLDGNWEVPWIISADIREIKEVMVNKQVTVVHTFREGNSLTDFLANLVVNFAAAESIQFNYIEELPAQAKSILHLDKKGTPNIRFKKGKNKYFKQSR